MAATTTAPAPTESRAAPGRVAAALAGLVVLPIALVVLLRLAPRIDQRWEEHSAHFWLVFATAAVSVGLAITVTEAGRLRRDARLLLIGLAFLVSAGFLGLHALATPDVIVAGRNASFVVATPIGLVAAGAFAAASAFEYPHRVSRWIVDRSRLFVVVILGLLGLWAALSLTSVPPFGKAVRPEDTSAWLGVVAGVGVILYAVAAVAYLRIYLRRGSALAFVVAFAFGLLAEALVVAVVALPTSWRLSWWEWHALMTIGFASIAVAAWREWHEERFSALYLEETLHRLTEVSVLFADLAGFTPFCEKRQAQEVHDMLVTYFGRLTPLLSAGFGGEVHEFVGDQIFAIFNKAGDDPDHGAQAARAALALQEAAAEIVLAHPDWPQFRVGVNSGPVIAGVVGERGHRVHGVFGDTVNVGARLEGQAPPGGVVIGEATYRLLPEGAEVEVLEGLRVKGKSGPVTAYVLHSVP
jgi:class 3 adenylate cyclase